MILLFNCTCHLSITTLWILIFMEFKFSWISWVFIQETWLNFTALVACVMLVYNTTSCFNMFTAALQGGTLLVTHPSNCYRAPRLAYPMH